MALSSCLCQSLSSSISIAKNHDVRMNLATCSDLRSVNTQISGRQVVSSRTIFHSHWSFVGGSRINLLPKVESNSSISRRKVCRIQASWFTTSQIASSMFTIGTAAVLPFYTLMVVAPKAEVTKKCMESSVPYIALGLLYAYLLYLSWTPNTLLYMFSSKYMLPELPGIAKMFSSEITLASAWIHLLVIDLFAARQVFHDGLENKIETRHSISLCLLFCPIGVCSHFITKALTSNSNDTKFDE